MMRRLFLLTAIALTLGTLAATAEPLPFPQEGSDLKPDPRITFGALPNGLRYVIMPNKEPKGRASVRLLVLAGSLEEQDSERGLAHYLEHMAFNGSAHLVPGTTWETLQRLGMGVGADVNASTSFDRTLYKLDLPSNDPKMLNEGLQILADYGSTLLLEQKMVDKERGIILSEKRERDDVEYRTWVAEQEFLVGSTRIPNRLPIGLTDVIEKATRDQFVSFYNTWYQPDLMVVVVVGDVDPAAVQAQVSDLFSQIKPRAPEVKKPDLGRPDAFTGVRTRFHSEPDAPATSITIAAVTPYAREIDTAAREIRLLKRSVALDILNRRLDVLSKKEGAPFIGAEAGVEESFNAYREATIDISCKPAQWSAALAVADQELRKALKYGFTPTELKEAVADLRNQFEQAVKTAPTELSSKLAEDISESILEGQVMTSPEADLALAGPVLDQLTPAECLAELRAAWGTPGKYVFVSGNLKLEGDAEAQIQAAYAKADAVPVAPVVDERKLTWDYTDFGAPGTVASRTHVDDLDITEVTFSNGVRLNLKKTDFEADKIHIAMRLGDGKLSEPAVAKPGIGVFANVVFSAGGLGKYSMDDLRRLLAGKNVGGIFNTTMDAFTLRGETNREDLMLEFQLLAASITDPGYRPEAVRKARQLIDTTYVSYLHTVQGPIALHVEALLASGDPRFGLPPRDQMMARNQEEVRQWLAPELQHGAIEIAVAGDFDVDTLIDAVAKTFGALPKRDPRPPLEQQQLVYYPSSPFTEDYGIDTATPKAEVRVFWRATDGLDIHRQRRLHILASVLEDRLRLKVREQLGSTYGAFVEPVASDIFPGYGYFEAITDVDPSKAKQIQDVVVQVAAELAANGATQDEIDRAKNPILSNINESARTNGYWMTVLGRAQEKPQVLDWARTRKADFTSITKEEIDTLARRYLGAEGASRVIIHPFPAPVASPLLTKPAPARDEPPPDGA